MFSRRLPIQTSTATTLYVGSSAGGVAIVATNLTRANLTLQPLLDGLRIMPVGSVCGSSMLVPTAGFYTAPDGYTGALYGSPNAGATSPVALQEFSF